MTISITGGMVDPRGFNTWQEWALALIHSLELQGDDVGRSVVTFDHETADVDASGRLRVSLPRSVHEGQFEYDIAPRIWDNFTAGTGAIVYDTNRRLITLSTGGTVSGARAMRQTRNYLRFRQGKSAKVEVAGVPVSAGTLTGAAKTRMGYFDDSNGVYFQMSSAGPAFVFRTNVSGSVVEFAIPQDTWNLDRLNGRGPSRKTLNPNKATRFIFDAQGAGVGSTRFGFLIEDQIIIAHSAFSANVGFPIPTIRTPNLPIRFEVINDGATGADVSMQQYSSAAQEEGSGPQDDEAAYLAFASNGLTQVTVPSNVLTPVLSIRLRDTFGGATVHAQVLPYEIQILNKSNTPGYFEVRGNPTLTGAAFTNVDTQFSITEFDVAATAATNGTKLIGGFVESRTGAASASVSVVGFPVRTSLGRFYSPTDPQGRDSLTVMVAGVGASIDVHATVKFRELF